MNIAFFTDAYAPRVNGVAVSVQSYARELCRLGHKACIVCPNYDVTVRDISIIPDSKEASLLEVRIPASREVFSKEDRAVSLLFIRKMNAWLDGWKPDAVHVNTEFTVGILGVRYAKRNSIPMVYTFHTLWEDYFANYIHILPPAMLRWSGRRLVKAFLRRADEIIVPTMQIKETVSRYGIERESYILPTGIPDFVAADIPHEKVKEFKIRLYEEFPNLTGKKILLYVGRMAKEKNLDLLISVLETVKKIIPLTALLFVGGGPEVEPLKKLTKEKNLSDSVAFAGYRERDELPFFYRVSDVFSFPSVTETQGLVTVEAMLSGLPVVAVGEMGTVDIMQGDKGGFMVHDDQNEFSERVVELLQNESLWQNKSKEASEWGRRWLISSLTPKLVERYRTAIESFR